MGMYNSMNPNFRNKMSGNKKPMSMSNLLIQDKDMGFNSSSNNMVANNYMSHKTHNFSTGQSGLMNRSYNKSQKDIMMFNHNNKKTMGKSPSRSNMNKSKGFGGSMVYNKNDNSRNKIKSPMRSRNKSNFFF